MDEFDIPIFKKTYELFKLTYEYRLTIPKQDRYAIWQRCEDAVINVMEGILRASRLSKSEKQSVLEDVSVRVNCLRVYMRLAKDVKAIDNKKYVRLEAVIDEIGRMTGGWIKATKER